jgi:F-type H+-transporting ATPase subunit epsilon
VSELQVSLVAVDRLVWEGAAKIVVAKTPLGEMGILPGHEPVLATLVDGEVRIETTEGEKLRAAVAGGFFSVDTNEVRILAEAAELAGEIDVERAKAAIERARAAGADDPDEIAAIQRAENRLRVASYHVHTTHSPR